MSLLRCAVIKIVVHTRVKSIVLVLHYALTEVSAFNHSTHIVFKRDAKWDEFHHTMQTFSHCLKNEQTQGAQSSQLLTPNAQPV